MNHSMPNHQLENGHTNNVTCTEQEIIRNIHGYTYTHASMHAVTMKEDAMNLQESEEKYMEGFEGRKWDGVKL